ncbi:MAG: hypothetical protein NZ805_13420 [Armatimonadetes bacterium]|nr:hypothetical protein [Armatimonadota bacterium]MDW8027087.1 hypothetical protein [Armatimonadota bacterium]
MALVEVFNIKGLIWRRRVWQTDPKEKGFGECFENSGTKAFDKIFKQTVRNHRIRRLSRPSFRKFSRVLKFWFPR